MGQTLAPVPNMIFTYLVSGGHLNPGQRSHSSLKTGLASATNEHTEVQVNSELYVWGLKSWVKKLCHPIMRGSLPVMAYWLVLHVEYEEEVFKS